MDIKIYNDVFTDLKQQMEKEINVSVLRVAPVSPKYPIIIFREVRNQPYFSNGGYLERVASLGYRVDVWAKDNNNKTKQELARELAFFANDFLTKKVGFKQVSWNESENESGGDLYNVIVTYSAPYFENKRKIL